MRCILLSTAPVFTTWRHLHKPQRCVDLQGHGNTNGFCFSDRVSENFCLLINQLNLVTVTFLSHYRIFKKDLFSFMCMSVCPCVCMCMYACSIDGGQKRTLDPLELELHPCLHVGAENHTWVLCRSRKSSWSLSHASRHYHPVF